MMKISGDVFKAYLSDSFNLQEFVRRYNKQQFFLDKQALVARKRVKEIKG